MHGSIANLGVQIGPVSFPVCVKPEQGILQCDNTSVPKTSYMACTFSWQKYSHTSHMSGCFRNELKENSNCRTNGRPFASSLEKHCKTFIINS